MSESDTLQEGAARAKPRAGRRKLREDQDPAARQEATKADIISVATKEFVAHGYEGASINDVASATKTSKRMLYYHFGSKRGLYKAVLEAAYERVGRREPSMQTAPLPPLDALRQYAEQAYDNFRNNEDFVRLVMAENLNNGAVIRESEFVRKRSAANLSSLESIWKRGCEIGVMRKDIRVLDLYLAIVAVCFHAVSNRISTSVSLGIDLTSPTELAFRRTMVGDIACSYAAAK